MRFHIALVLTGCTLCLMGFTVTVGVMIREIFG